MGLPLSLPLDIERFNKHPGKQHVPDDTLQILPERWKVSPGGLITFFRALPPGVRFLDIIPDNLYWWPDVKFLPHSECSVVVSVGAYLHRPNLCPLIAYSATHGTLYTMTFGKNLGWHLYRGSSLTCLPNVAVHPNGRLITCANTSKIIIMDLWTQWTQSRLNELRHNNFSYTTFTPNGKYVASMARCSRFIELETFRIVNRQLVKQFCIECHKVCPGFRTDMRNPGRFECRFSPDSRLIACGLSHGQLFVVFRYELRRHCNVIPGMFDESQTAISNERTFDFDPRFQHQILAFCDTNGKLHVCDIEDVNSTPKERLISPSLNIQCLKYCPSGRTLAVALSDATIQLLDPDTLDCLHTLDGSSLDLESRMSLDANGTYPTLIHMSYASTGNLLITTATDGIVRLWQLWPDLSLQQLCRRQVLQLVSLRDVIKLPLPPRIISFLLQWPE